MSTFDIVIILGGICGLCMVIGGLILLYKGAITLSQATPEEALSVEYKNMLKISTHYPALALFIIGLFFIIAAGVLSRTTKNQFTIKGKLTGVEDPSLLKVEILPSGSWDGKVYEGGEMMAEPNLNYLDVKISQAGYKQIEIPVDIRKNLFGTISLDPVSFGVKVVTQPQTGTIVAPPVDLPPVGAQGKFGHGGTNVVN